MKLGITVYSVICLLACAGIAAQGCKSTGLTEDEAVTVRKYEAEQLLCVDAAKTREESQQCRCEVKARYGRPCALPTKDGGL